MTPTVEICKNCEHAKTVPDRAPTTVFDCLVWSRMKLAQDTCQYFQIAERLLPTRYDIYTYPRKSKRKTVREREGKPNMTPL